MHYSLHQTGRESQPKFCCCWVWFSELTIRWTGSDSPLGLLRRSLPLCSGSEHLLTLPFYSTFATCLCRGHFYVAASGFHLCQPLIKKDSDHLLGLQSPITAAQYRLGAPAWTTILPILFHEKDYTPSLAAISAYLSPGYVQNFLLGCILCIPSMCSCMEASLG